MPVIHWYHNLNLVARFTVTGLALTVLAGGIVTGVVGWSIERSALDNEASNVSEMVAQTLGPSLAGSDFESATNASRTLEISLADQSLAAHSRIRDVQIWTHEGTLIYGRDPEMIGFSYLRSPALDRALTGATTSTPVFVQSIMPEQLEQGLQTHAPIRAMDGTVLGAYQIQHSTIAVSEQIQSELRIIWLGLTAGFALLYGGLFGIVKRASSELAWQHRELAQLSSRRELDRMKTEFASTVSHELRAPLTTLIGYSELLLTRGAQGEQEREWAEHIHLQSVRMSDLLTDILTASVIEDNAVVVNPQPIDLPGIVSRVIGTLPPSASELTIDANLPPSLPPIMADREKLQQILTNLLTNAIKYSPDGGEVRFSAALVNGRLRLSIIDHGLGIRPDDLAQLFERFHRVHTRAHPEIHGTGLGLYISRGLAVLQGGMLWAESEGEGRGSTFHLELPLAPMSEALPAAVVRPTLAIGASR
ncbi:MAG: sensor histidine kinase [Chloroflexota bacterium]